MRSKSEEYPSNAVWVSEPHQAQTSRAQGITCWLTFRVHPIQISSIDYIWKLVSNVQGFNQGWRSPNLCCRILPFVSLSQDNAATHGVPPHPCHGAWTKAWYLGAPYYAGRSTQDLWSMPWNLNMNPKFACLQKEVSCVHVHFYSFFGV